MRTLDSHNIKSGQANLEVSTGQWAGFFLRAEGVNAATKDTLITDFGLITGLWGDFAFCNVKWDQLAYINDLTMGYVEAANATGAAFSFSVFLPAGIFNDGNVLDVSEADNVRILVNLSGIDSDQSSGTLELIGVPGSGHTRYIPHIVNLTPNVAANGVDPIPIPQANVTHVFIGNQANVSRVAILVDGNERTEVKQAALQATTNMLFNKEAAYTTMSAIPLHPTGDQLDSFANDVVVRITAGSGGAATPDIVTLSKRSAPEVFNRSIANARAMARAKVSLKKNTRRFDDVKVAALLRSDLAAV